MPYSHRNGETTPPTMRGRYWLKRIGVGPLVFLAKKKYGKVLFVVDLDVPATEIKGRWWGPVTLPWEQDAP